jgi:PAS domain S-box-containing protein
VATTSAARAPDGARWSAPELEAILDALPARVTWWDSRLRLRYANAEALVASGQAPSQLLGRRLQEFLGDWMTDHAENFDRAFVGEPQQLERTITVDHDVRHLDVHLRPVVDEGAVTSLVVFSVDDTALVEAQQAARRNTERGAVLTERQRIAAELGALVIDRMSVTKDELELAAAATPESSAVLRKSASRRLDDVMVSLRSTIRSLRESPDVSNESGVVADDPVLSTQLLMSADRQPAPTSVSGHLSVRELLVVLDALPAAITAFDRGFYNTFANQVAVDVYRFGSRAAVYGRQGVELLGQAAYDASLPYGEAAMEGHPQQFVRTIPDPSGGSRSAQIDYVAQIVDGEAVGAVALVLDVTAQVAAEAAALASAERLTVLSDRARIAEDLHDLVIQRMFAAGLMLTSAQGGDPETIRLAIECIDDALDELQQSVHELHGRTSGFHLEAALERAIRQASRPLGFSPLLSWDGPGRAVSTDVAVDVIAVVSEALSNAARHAQPSQVDVQVSITDREAQVRVTDNGTGMGSPSRRSGLANLAARAERHGGRFACNPNRPRGTVLEWQAPIA